MQIEREASSETHNLILSSFLTNHQIKFFSYHKIDSHKILYKSIEHRFLNGLVAAGRNLIKLFAIYDNNYVEELGQWRSYQDITGIYSWDRNIVVQTRHKIIGLKFENSMLKNSFMLTLQFLPIEKSDECSVIVDRSGYYLTIHIKNYLLICFSEAMSLRQKSKIIQKPKMQLIGEEVRWNEAGKNYIMDVVKIKLSDFQFNKIQQLHCFQEFLFFFGHKNKQKMFYFINILYFFNTLNVDKFSNKLVIQNLPDRVIGYPIVHNNHKQMQFLLLKQRQVILQYQQGQRIRLISFDNEYQVLNKNSHTVFPLVMRQTKSNIIKIIDRTRNYQESYDFALKQINLTCKPTEVIYKDGLFAYFNQNQIAVNHFAKKQDFVKIHKSLGNIIDFHMGKNMLLIQNHQDRKTKLFDFSRNFKIDPKPYVTHKKKMFLQNLSGLMNIKCYSIFKNQQKYDLIAVQRNINGSKILTFYKENEDDFQIVRDNDILCYQTIYEEESYLVIINKCNGGIFTNFNSQQYSFVIDSEYLSKLTKKWIINQYLILKDNHKWKFLNMITQEQSSIELRVERQGEYFLNSFIQRKGYFLDKNSKNAFIVQIYLCYANLLQIWSIDITNKSVKLVHSTKMVGEGFPILSNSLLNENHYLQDKLRCITCPEYVIKQQNIQDIHEKQIYLQAYYLYEYEDLTLLLMVTSEDQLMVYRKYFCCNKENQFGFVYKRIHLPLNIIKSFKFTGSQNFGDLGQKIVKVCNYYLCKGEFLEYIPQSRSFFRMDNNLWVVMSDAKQVEMKIRMVNFKGDVFSNFIMTQIQSNIKQEMMGIESSAHYYCIYNRKMFEVMSKQILVHWRAQLNNQTIVCLRLFEHYVAMSYYDYYENEDGVGDLQSIRFRFRIYNCTTKNKIIEKEKTLDEPIIHIRYFAPDKLILATSSIIFINVIKNDKTLQLSCTHNFSSKRSFLSSYNYLPDIPPQKIGENGRPGYMLFGGSHGGLSFFVGKWIEEGKLNEQWFQGFRCNMRDIFFFHYGQEAGQLKALIADDDQNLIAINLKKNKAEKLADFHLGALVNAFKSKSTADKTVYLCMDDGNIKLISPVKLQNIEISLLDFQEEICKQMPFLGGFNLRTSRELRQNYRSCNIVSRGNIIDSDIIEEFFTLTNTLKKYIVRETQLEISTIKSYIP